jgi:hypothetical protein
MTNDRSRAIERRESFLRLAERETLRQLHEIQVELAKVKVERDRQQRGPA